MHHSSMHANVHACRIGGMPPFYAGKSGTWKRTAEGGRRPGPTAAVAAAIGGVRGGCGGRRDAVEGGQRRRARYAAGGAQEAALRGMRPNMLMWACAVLDARMHLQALCRVVCC